MDSKQLLISSINLIYLESKLSDTSRNSRKLVRSSLDFVEVPDNNLGSISLGSNLILDLKGVCEWMLGKEENYDFEPSSVLQKIKSSSEMTDKLLDAFKETIRPIDMKLDTDFSFVSKMTEEIREDLTSFAINLSISEVIRKASRDVEFSRDPKAALAYAKKLMVDLEPLTHNTKSGLHPGVVDFVDLSDSANLTEMISMGVEALNSGAVLKTDIQDLNNMFEGGFWPGKTYMYCGLQHMFKSGMGLTIIRGVISCNKPILIDPTKKPLILRVSSENTSRDDVIWLYKNLREIETGVEIVIRDIDPVVAGDYVAKWVSKSGFHFINYKVNPNKFTVDDLLNLLSKLIANGYEIKFFLMDYLAMLDKAGLSGGNDSDKIRDMFRRVKNFSDANMITTLTPHQISTEAKKLKRADAVGVTCFVKEVVGKGYTDGCTRIEQEVDGDFAIDITKMVVDGVKRSYLEIARGKHRIPIITEEKHLYTVLPFRKVGTIHPDIDGKNSGLTRPGGDFVPNVDMNDF